MPRNDRAPSFQFYPADYLADPAVSAMSFDQQGRYFRALCLTWQTASPGLATEDQWRAWMNYSADEWAIAREALKAAFRIGRDGRWTQKRTVETRKAQVARQKQARMGAAATNERRWGSVAPRQVRRSPSDGSGARSTVSPSSASASASAPSSSSPPEESTPSRAKTELSAERPGDVPAGTTGDESPPNRHVEQPPERAGLTHVGRVLGSMLPGIGAPARPTLSPTTVTGAEALAEGDRSNVPAPHRRPPVAGVLAQIDADHRSSLRDHEADPEAGARALAEVERLLADVASSHDMEDAGHA